MLDERTKNRNYPLPAFDNLQEQDVPRLREALNAIDKDIVEIVSLPSGGTTGQVLAKVSGENGDAGWRDLAGAYAPLGEDGKVPAENLPDMAYAPLGEDGKVPAENLPDMAYIPTTIEISALIYAESESAALAISNNAPTTLVVYSIN